VYYFISHTICTNDLLHPSAAPSFKLSGISDLLSDVSSIQHHTKICSKYENILISSLNYMSSLLVKGSSPCWTLLLPWQPWIEFHEYTGSEGAQTLPHIKPDQKA
jgi:hypothetical protein